MQYISGLAVYLSTAHKKKGYQIANKGVVVVVSAAIPSSLFSQENIKKVCQILDNQLSHELREVAKKDVLRIIVW